MSDLLKGLGSALTGVTNLLSGGALIDGLGGALGLPPIITNTVKVVAGAMTGNVMLAADGAIGVAQELSKNPPAATEYKAPKDDKVACEGYARQPWHQGAPATGSVSQGSHLDPKMGEYFESLRTLNENFRYLDATDGKLDGSLSLEDLKRISNDARVSPGLRDAARFLVDNPGYFERLDNAGSAAAAFGMKDRKNDDRIDQGNLHMEIMKVRSDFAQYGRPGRVGSSAPSAPSPGTGDVKPPASGTTGSTPPGGSSSTSGPASSSVKNIINDPSLSLEEKINAILMNLTEKMDGEILDTMDALAAAQDKKAGLSNDKGSEKAMSDTQRDIDRISMRLQQLVEKRKTMFDMMSTLSMKFNEMAKTALSNMRSA